MDDEAFDAFFLRTAQEVGRRTCREEDVVRAQEYPWHSGGDTVAAGPPGAGEDGRYPLLAIGSNAAPARLELKLASLPEEDRVLPVSPGELHDLDVGVSAHPTAYGSLPATLFASAGTAVRSTVLWVTSRQLTHLTWTELTYRLGRLDAARFTADDGTPVDRPLVFASRFGAFCPTGEPVALAAIPALRRTAIAHDQRILLDLAAPLALGARATGEDLVRAVLTDLRGFVTGPGRRLREYGRPLTAAGWTPWPGGSAT